MPGGEKTVIWETDPKGNIIDKSPDVLGRRRAAAQETPQSKGNLDKLLPLSEDDLEVEVPVHTIPKRSREAVQNPLDVKVFRQAQTASTVIGDGLSRPTEIQGVRAPEHLPPSARDQSNQTGVIPRRAPQKASGGWKSFLPRWMGGK